MNWTIASAITSSAPKDTGPPRHLRNACARASDWGGLTQHNNKGRAVGRSLLARSLSSAYVCIITSLRRTKVSHYYYYYHNNNNNMLLILLDYQVPSSYHACMVLIIIMIHNMLCYDKKNLSILTTTVTTTLPAGY